jgi:hypothetical protein
MSTGGNYALCERVEPIELDNGQYGYFRKRYIVKMRGNSKKMTRLRKMFGERYIVSFTNKAIGQDIYF